jgi:hypothetical protein
VGIGLEAVLSAIIFLIICNYIADCQQLSIRREDSDTMLGPMLLLGRID